MQPNSSCTSRACLLSICRCCPALPACVRCVAVCSVQTNHIQTVLLLFGLLTIKDPVPPAPPRYDLAWVQLALMYLTDEDAVALLRRCARGLKPGGLLVVKEGALEHGFVDYILDKPNHGFGRCASLMR